MYSRKSLCFMGVLVRLYIPNIFLYKPLFL